LIVTLSIMASGTILIVLVPGYETIGLFAPALVLIGRLLQGFSAGAELGGVSVYLSEIATPAARAFSPLAVGQSAGRDHRRRRLGLWLNAWMAPAWLPIGAGGFRFSSAA
jgi:MHS family citrate/tricarballylate:H+ symporter-like MFS transporter